MGCIEIDFGNDGYKLTAVLSKDGNKWRVLFGENLQNGIAGFGDSIWQAIDNFKMEFRNT